MGTGDKSTVTNFWRGERGGKLSVGHSLARRFKGRKSPPSLSVMVVRTLQPTVLGFAFGRVSEHFTVKLLLKPNSNTALEFKHVNPHDAKRLLAVVVFLVVIFAFV